jgi:hypothetical protein
MVDNTKTILKQSMLDFLVCKWFACVEKVWLVFMCIVRWFMIWLQDCKDVPPYLFKDKGYILLPWLMTPHKKEVKWHIVLELLYNCKHQKERSVIGNAFSILKQTFIELLKKQICIALLFLMFYYLFPSQLDTWEDGIVDVEQLMRMFQSKMIQNAMFYIYVTILLCLYVI